MVDGVVDGGVLWVVCGLAVVLLDSDSSACVLSCRCRSVCAVGAGVGFGGIVVVLVFWGFGVCETSFRNRRNTADTQVQLYWCRLRKRRRSEFEHKYLSVIFCSYGLREQTNVISGVVCSWSLRQLHRFLDTRLGT